MDRFLTNLAKRKFAREIIPLLALILLYTAVALFNLGNRESPQSYWSSEDAAIIDFGEIVHVSRFQFMMGARHDVPFMLYASLDGYDWHFALEVDESPVFAWGELHVGTYAKYAQIIPFWEGLRLQEVAFRDRYDRVVVPHHIFAGAEALFDEQWLVPQHGSFMNSTYFDEIYHARTGYEFLHGLQIYETTHPPMGKNLIALGIRVFGMTPFGWRLPGTIAGILMIPLMYLFGRMMFRSAYWGMFAAFIFTFDFMPFVQTRIATIDSFLTLFVISSYLCMYAYVRDCDEAGDKLVKKGHWRALLYLFGSGLFIGLAISVKWQGVYALIGLPFLFFPAWYRVYLRDASVAWRTFGACFAFFIAVPVAVYLLSYIPFVQGANFWDTVFANQLHMFSYHSELVAEHPFASRWWEWPLMIRPVFYYANAASYSLRQGISSFGNPAVWWTGIFATVFALFSLWDKKQAEHRQVLSFLLIAYAAQFVPWVFVYRITFIYHYFPSLPFVVLLIVFFMKNYVWPKFPRMVWAYGVLVLGLFVLFYPVLSATPVSVEFVRFFLRWLPAWILV